MDIAFCRNHDCIKRTKCLRFMGQPGFVQSYAQFTPENNMEGKFECNHYINLKDYNTPKRDSKQYKERKS